MSVALASVGMSAPSGLVAGDQPEIRFRGTEVEVDVEVDCPQGGSLGVHGTFTQNGVSDPANPSAAVDISFSYSVGFDGCKAADVVIEGSIDYSLDMQTDSATNSYSYHFEFSGEVGFSGAVSGTCEIEATGSVSSGDTTAVSYEGTICGFAAGELDV
jgi:hypothetical protein